jgi:hypothetical protein
MYLKMIKQKNLYAIIFCALLCVSYQTHTLSKLFPMSQKINGSALQTNQISDGNFCYSPSYKKVRRRGIFRTFSKHYNDASKLYNNEIYCIKAVHSNKFIGVLNVQGREVSQSQTVCTDNNSYRLLKSNNEFRFMNIRTGRFLTESFRSEGSYNHIYLEAKDDVNDPRQRWKIESYGHGQFQIFGSMSNFVFDILGNSKKDHAKLVAFGINPKNENQRFKFFFVGMFREAKPSTQIVPKHIARKVGYQIAHLNEFFDGGIYCLKNVKSKKVIGVEVNSTKVVQSGNKCDTNHTFKIIRIGQSDEYRIESMTGRGAFTPRHLNENKQPIVVQPFSKFNTSQRWKFSYRVEADRKKKEIQIRNVASSYTLDIYDGNIKDQAEVIAWVNNHKYPNERFTITLVDVN